MTNNVLDKINIDQELPQEEIKAIDALGKINANDLKKALQTEKLRGSDRTFTEMIDAFSTYNVQYEGGDDYREAGFTYNNQNSTPDRLKNMLNDKDDNDFAYLVYKISEFLNVDKENGLQERKITKETITQLTQLKTKILKQEIEAFPDTQPNENTASTINQEQGSQNTEQISKTEETLAEDDITIKLYNGITKEEIVDAVNQLKKSNLELAKKIILLLKAGNVLELQTALGMKKGEVPLYKKADGKFGKYTLQNLKAGEVVEPQNTTPTTTSSSGSTTNSPSSTSTETSAVLNEQKVNIDGVEHTIHTITDISQLPENLGNENSSATSENAKIYEIAGEYGDQDVIFRFFGNGKVWVGVYEKISGNYKYYNNNEKRANVIEKDSNNKRKFKDSIKGKTIINDLKLNEIVKKIDKKYYGIPNDVNKIYGRQGYNGYYFFKGNKLRYVPDLFTDNISKIKGPICIQQYDPKIKKRTPEYPNDSLNFSNFLSMVFYNTLTTNNIPISGKSVVFEKNKYYIKSFDNKISIELKTLIRGRIVDGPTYTYKELGQNLQLLNLVNFINKERRNFTTSSKFEYKDGNIIVTGFKNYIGDYDILSQKAIKEKYNFMDNKKIENFVTYLNENLIPKV